MVFNGDVCYGRLFGFAGLPNQPYIFAITLNESKVIHGTK